MRYFRSLLFVCLFFQIHLSQASNKVLPVKSDGYWGLIDTSGNWVVTAQYDGIHWLGKKGFIVEQSGKMGLLDAAAKPIIPIKFDNISVLEENLFLVFSHGKVGCYHKNGQEILATQYDDIQQFKVTNHKYSYWCSRDKASLFFSIQKAHKYGAINSNGKLLFSPQYDSLALHHYGYIETVLHNKKGLLDTLGNTILPPIYDNINLESKDFIKVVKKSKIGAADSLGQVFIEPKWNHITPIYRHLYKLENDTSFVLFNRNTRQTYAIGDYSDFKPLSTNSSFLLVFKEKKVGLISETGQEILPPEYDEIRYFGNFFKIKISNKWGLASRTGQVLITPDYDHLSIFQNNVAQVTKNGLQGLVNRQGKEIAPTVYTKIKIDGNSLKLYRGEAMTLAEIDNQGNIAETASFKKVKSIKIRSNNSTPYVQNAPSGSLTPMTIDTAQMKGNSWFFDAGVQRWGLMNNESGEELIPPLYVDVSPKNDLGFTLVEYRAPKSDESRYGLVDHQAGKPLTKPNFKKIFVDDFKVSQTARCLILTGSKGLMTRNGSLLVHGVNYIGSFNNGLARTNFFGKLYVEEHQKDEPDLGSYLNYIEEWHGTGLMYNEFKRSPRFVGKKAVLRCKNCKWGFIDSIGRTIIKPIYDFSYDFVNGTAIVKKGDKWGVIGTAGEVLLDFKYDHISYLPHSNHQLFEVKINATRYGVIDHKGNVTVDVRYHKVGEFKEGRVAMQCGGKWTFANESGEHISDCIFGRVQDFSEGLAAVRHKGKWGYINPSGDMVIAPKYSKAGNFTSGLAWVMYKGKYGYIDQNGSFVIAPEYLKSADFQENIAIVSSQGKMGVIDRRGKFVIAPQYQAIETFGKNGLAAVRYKSGKWGLINRKGEKVLSGKYSKIESFSEGLAAVYKDRKYGFIDSTGSEVIKAQFDRVGAFSEGKASIFLDGKWGYIDRSGTVIITPQFKNCADFKDHKAVVELGYKEFGLIDTAGNYLIEPIYQSITPFSQGISTVSKNYSFGFINDQNETVIAQQFKKAGIFVDSLAVVNRDGKWGVINTAGFAVVPPQFDRLTDYQNQYATARINQLTGIADLNGELLVEPQFGVFTYMGDHIFKVVKGAEVGYLRSAGTWLWVLRQ